MALVRRLLRRLGPADGSATLMTATTLLVAATMTMLMVTLVSHLAFQQRVQAAADAAALAAAMEVRRAFLDNLSGNANLRVEEVQRRGVEAARAMVRAQGFDAAASVRVAYPAVFEVQVEVGAPFPTGQVSAKASAQIAVPN